MLLGSPSSSIQQKSATLSFQVGDQVLALKRPIIMSHKTGSEFAPNWEGPHVVREVYSNSAYKIIDGQELRVGLINDKFLKHYFP